MYETTCVKIRLKPGSLGRVREWAAEINRRRNEALATLRDERVVVESVFLESGAEGDFLVYYMKAASLAESLAVADKSRHAIDEYHRRFMREVCTESRERLELLVDLDHLGEADE